LISLVLPYWDRQEAANKALAAIAAAYPDTDLEVVVVDDGNRVPFDMPLIDLQMTCVRLPVKDEALSPVTAWNRGVEFAQGDIIALSCIEIMHHRPVLEQMATELENLGPNGYVLAAAWCPDLNEWHCHSRFASSGAPELPEGCGRAFLGMMNRSLFERAGGFDEEYRMGAGYEDIDFVHRLLAAGAKFKIRDDLVVSHPKRGASINWGAEKFARNRELLKEKWPC
jgi:glycosyltransferase involved in cell wall biosynthesis